MIALVLGGLAHAHNPHDLVPLLAVPPDYDAVRMLLGATHPAQNWRPVEIVRSDDDGVRWRQAMAGLATDAPLSSMALSQSYQSDGIGLVTTLNGAWATADGAATWVRAGLEGKGLKGAAIVAGPLGPRFLAVEVEGSVWQSDDAGVTWQSAPFVLGLDPPVHAAAEHVAVVSDELVWVSHDGGETWDSKPLPAHGRAVAVAANGDVLVGTASGVTFLPLVGAPSQLPGTNATVTHIGVGPNWPVDPFLVVATIPTQVMVSEDRGSTFLLRGVPIRTSDQADGAHFYSIQIPSVGAGERVFINMFEGLVFSDDRGLTWTQRDVRPPHLVTGITLSPAFGTDRAVVVGTYDGGVYTSGDAGETFEVRNRDLLRPNVYDVLVAPTAKGPEVWVATLGYLARGALADDGYTLDLLYEAGTYPTQMVLSPLFLDDGYALSGTRVSGILRSLDAGATWTQQADVLSQLSSVAIGDDTALGLCASVDGTVRATSDGGTTWLELPEFPAAEAPSFVVAGDGGFLIGSPHGLYTWDGTTVAAVAEVPDPIDQVAVGPDGTRFVVVRGGPILRSDPGQAFVDLGLVDGLVPQEIAISPDFAQDDTVFVAAGVQVFRSTDRGVTWAAVDPDPVRYEETCQAVSREGELQSLPMSGASARTVEVVTSDSPTTLTFDGTGVTWLGSAGGAPADVELDGVILARVDPLSSTTGAPLEGNLVRFVVEGLPAGLHALTVRPTGAGDVHIDAFDVTRVESPSTTTAPSSSDPTDPATDRTDTGEALDPGPSSSAADPDGCACSSAAGMGTPWLVRAAVLVGRRRSNHLQP